MEVTAVRFDTSTELAWASAGPGAGAGTVHDVIRDDLAPLPVGGETGETCLVSGITASTVSDPSGPDPGAGYRYLVRRSNICGTGTWGFATGGTERLTGACP